MESKWYVINVLSGYESKVVKLIKENALKQNISDMFQELIIPVENIVEYKKGKKIGSEKKIFPGYIMIKMVLNDLTWNIVKNTRYVTKLLGGGNKPIPISEAEVKRVLEQVAEGKVVKEVQKVFEVAESIKITDGPFETFTGLVEEVDSEKKRLKVLVSIFGRDTPVELEYNQVEKLN